MNDSGTPTFNVCRQIYDVATNPMWNVNSQLFIDAIKPLLLAWRTATAGRSSEARLAQAVGLLREFTQAALWSHQHNDWVCPDCRHAGADGEHQYGCRQQKLKAFLAQPDIAALGGKGNECMRRTGL